MIGTNGSQNNWTPCGYLTYSVPTTNFHNNNCTLKDGAFITNGSIHTAIVDGDTSYSNIKVERNARAEIWMEYRGGTITWPSDLVWSNVNQLLLKNNELYMPNGEPQWEANNKYFIKVLYDGQKIIANVSESYYLNPTEDVVIRLNNASNENANSILSVNAEDSEGA